MVDQANIQEIVASIRAGNKVSIDDGVDVWVFDKTQEHEKERLGKQFVSLAANVDQQWLYRLAGEPVSPATRIYMLDERGTSMKNFSLSELINKKDIYKITSKMREGRITEYQSIVDAYADCPGSLYWIANELSLAVYDERGGEELEKVSLQIFKELAEKGDARACHEVANHYYFNTSEQEEVVKWRLLAIEAGEAEDLRQLADFIIDEYRQQINLALDTLHTMQQYHLHEAWSFWKEGQILMEGLGGIDPDPARGMALLQKASDLGHTVAKSSLASYYYTGKGVPRDLHKALQLLIEANEASKTFNNKFRDPEEEETIEEGDYEDIIDKIKRELNIK